MQASGERGANGAIRRRPGALRMARLLLEGPRAFAEATTLVPAWPLLLTAPRGDGHPVLVLPGFGAGDDSTSVLRAYLRGRGYRVYAWKLGRNGGLPDGVGGRLADRLASIRSRRGQKVSLVGWSMGGVYARELARLKPASVRQVISLGSPFAGAVDSPRVAWLRAMVYGDSAGGRVDLGSPPPVPSTAIFSRGDAIVSWRVARERGSPATDNIEVRGSHIGLGVNPTVLYAIADRLALPEDRWKRFDPGSLRGLAYVRERSEP